MKKSIFAFFAACMVALSANAQFFTAIVNPTSATDITNDTVLVTAEAYASGPFNYYVKFKQTGAGSWSMTDTANGNGNGPIAKLITGLSGSTQYQYEFGMYDTITGQSFTSADGLVFTTSPNPQPTVVDPDWLISATATSATFIPRVHAVGGPVLVYAEYNTENGTGYPFKTDSMQVTGTNQYAILHAFGLAPEDTFKVRIRTIPLYNSGGVVQPTATPQKYFSTLALTTAEASSVTQSAQGQDSIGVTGIVALGSSGQAQYKFELIGGNGMLSQGGVFVYANTSGAYYRTFYSLQPDSGYTARLIVKDGSHYDTITASVTTSQVLPPSGATLPLVVYKNYGMVIADVNPNGTYPCSVTTVKAFWGKVATGYTDSAMQVITTQQQVPFTFGWFNAATPVMYKITATNEGGTTPIAQSTFTTSAPFAEATLSTGQVFVSAGTVMFNDWGYGAASGDTIRIVMERVPTASGGNVLDSSVVGTMFMGTGLFGDTMFAPVTSTVYFRAKAVNSDGSVSYSAVVSVQTQQAYAPDYLVSVSNVDQYTQKFWIGGDAGGYPTTISIEVKHQGITDYTLHDAPVGSGMFSREYEVAPLQTGILYNWKVCIKNSFYGEICKSDATGTFEIVSTGMETTVNEEKELHPNTVCEAYNLAGQRLGRCTVAEVRNQGANLAAQWNTTGTVIMVPVVDENGQTVLFERNNNFKVVLIK